MPFSILINSYPKTDVSVGHVQGPAIQAMFLSVFQQIDPNMSAHLHDEPGYRPFTLSPLGIYEKVSRFQGFWLPHGQILHSRTACYLRITLLEDDLFSIFRRYFLEKSEPSFMLGGAEFAITDVLYSSDNGNAWGCYLSYPALIDRAFQQRRKLKLRFLTPTSFSQGKTDLPLPLPRLVFRSYMKRFEQFYQVAFLSDFEELVDYYVGIANLKQIRTAVIKTKHVSLIGFTGDVVFMIHPQTPPDLTFQLNLLAEYAFFCGTGKKTVLGMGQTVLERDFF
jgi:CRISPR-associated endoribonuclease Cas6